MVLDASNAKSKAWRAAPSKPKGTRPLIDIALLSQGPLPGGWPVLSLVQGLEPLRVEGRCRRCAGALPSPRNFEHTRKHSKFGKASCDAQTHSSSRTICTTGPITGDPCRSCLVAHTDNVLASKGPIHKSKHHARQKEYNIQNKPGKEASQSHRLKGQMPSICPEPLQQVRSPSYHS